MNYNLVPVEHKENGMVAYAPRPRISRFNKFLAVLLILLILFLLLGFAKKHGAYDVSEDELNAMEVVEVTPTTEAVVEEEDGSAVVSPTPAPKAPATAPKAPAPAPTETAPAPTETVPAPTEAPTAPAPTETVTAPTEAPTTPAPVAKAWIVSRNDNSLTIGFQADGNGSLVVNLNGNYTMNTAQAFNSMAVGYDNGGSKITVKLVDINPSGGSIRIDFLESIEDANIQVSFKLG